MPASQDFSPKALFLLAFNMLMSVTNPQRRDAVARLDLLQNTFRALEINAPLDSSRGPDRQQVQSGVGM